jgi:hypothetical protein
VLLARIGGFVKNILNWILNVFCATSFAWAQTPDIIFYNGKIFTSNVVDSFEQWKGGLTLLVNNPEEGRQAVDRLHGARVDFIKIHTQMDRETWSAIVSRVCINLEWHSQATCPVLSLPPMLRMRVRRALNTWRA